MFGIKNPIETLLNEHSRILEVLEDFEIILKNDFHFWLEKKFVFNDFVLFLSLYADKLHHEKEEKILFPLIQKVAKLHLKTT